MTKKISVESKYVPLSQALDAFVSRTTLFTLLQEGTVIARGRLGRYSNDRDEYSSEPADIPVTVWSDYTLTSDLTLADGYESFYEAIEIERTQLENLRKSTAVEMPEKNVGGRPQKWKWDEIWPEIFIAAFENQPQNLNDWVRKVTSLSVWKGHPPDDSTLEKKLRRYFPRIAPPGDDG